MNYNNLKKFNRNRRIQYSDESFASGIKYATSPLAAGFARNLVNFDLGEDGDSLLPRQGLRVFEGYSRFRLSIESGMMQELVILKNKYIMLTEVIEEDGNTYRQVLLGNVNFTEENKNDAVKTGNLDLLTIYPKGY